MDKNAIITVIEDVIGEDKIEYISGEIQNCGTETCQMSGERGSVYGVAIQLSIEQKPTFFDGVEQKKKNLKIESWKTIGGNFYPLYWGIDINMGMRLAAHIKDYVNTGALQLNKLSLSNCKIIYGAVPCLNRARNEKTLREKYPDILKTNKKKPRRKCDGS